ncbi:MAG TPA: polysaccharide biosynthesis tyrosine autokinase [Verrucomicrobiae bacterium]
MNEEAVETSYARSGSKGGFAAKLRYYWDLIGRKWWVLAAGVVVGGAVVAGVARFQAAAYVSAGQMIVNVKLALPQGSLFTEELGNFLGTQAALMQSDVVINRAFTRVASGMTNAPGRPPELRVSVSPRTTIFNLRATGPDPGFTRAFLQATMEEYIRLKREMRKQTSESTVADLTEEVLTVERALRKSEEEVAEFQGTNSLVWIEEQGNTMGNYLAGLNQRLGALKSEHDMLQSLTLDQNLQRGERSGEAGAAGGAGGEAAGGAEAATNAVVNNNTLAVDYLKARQQLLLMKAEQQDLAQYLRPKHPKMVTMSEEIARRERLLEIYRQQNAEQLEARKASVALQIQNLEKDLNDWNGRFVELSRKSSQYQRLKANAQRLRALYQQLLGTVQTVDATKEIGAESVSIMEPASPAVLDERRRRNNLVFGGVACVLGTIALLMLLERLDDRVNSFTELQLLFEEPVLAQIPREKKAGGKKGVAVLRTGDDRHGFLEAYRNLRSSLLYLAEPGARPRTLLFTSSIPEEGKSLTVANLGITLAEAGSRVLLVDADLRKGVLHERFGQAAAAGLCEALRDGVPWQDLARPTAYKNLSLLPRGGVCRETGELFLGARAGAFLKESASAYDFVIVDTAPVMAADDVTSLAPRADAVVFVLRAEHTSARVAHAALELLYQRKARVLGMVFNAVRRRSGDYYFYKYKDYYTGYPAAEG